MKVEDLKERTKEVLADSYAHMLDKIDHAISSGAMNIEDAEDNYILPKVLAKAILKDAAESIGLPIGSISKKLKRDVERIYASI